MVGTPSSLSDEASRTKARSRRTSPPGAREDTRAPIQAPGTLPMMSEAVRASWKSPKKMWPRAADITSGTAWTRSVPTREFALRVG